MCFICFSVCGSVVHWRFCSDQFLGDHEFFRECLFFFRTTERSTLYDCTNCTDVWIWMDIYLSFQCATAQRQSTNKRHFWSLQNITDYLYLISETNKYLNWMERRLESVFSVRFAGRIPDYMRSRWFSSYETENVAFHVASCQTFRNGVSHLWRWWHISIGPGFESGEVGPSIVLWMMHAL